MRGVKWTPLKRALLSRKALKPATPFHAIRVIPSRSGSEAHEFGKEVLPGTEKRTVIDLTRKQPEYESPYAGPAVNPNTSGVSQFYSPPLFLSIILTLHVPFSYNVSSLFVCALHDIVG
jgi:hypothetical protein